MMWAVLGAAFGAASKGAEGSGYAPMFVGAAPVCLGLALLLPPQAPRGEAAGERPKRAVK